MTEEEYFIKHYPDFCYYDKPLSPYWDLFEYGVEFGERQSEKRITELEEKLNAIDKAGEHVRQQINNAFRDKPSYAELEKENAELKHNKKTVAHLADCLEEKMKERIEELEQQIEKMKCCGNCDNTWNGMKLDICADCKNHNKWRIKEND